MPKPIDAAEAKVFKTKDGGCHPHWPHLLHKDHPLYKPNLAHPLQQPAVGGTTDGTTTVYVPPSMDTPDPSLPATLPGTAPQTADFRDEYNARFQDETQISSGICTGEACQVAIQWCRYKVQGAAVGRFCGPFIYYQDTGDATFKNGSSPFSPFISTMRGGACHSSFYSPDAWAADFLAWPGHVFVGSELPQTTAYQDALKRRTLYWKLLAISKPDMNQLNLWLAAGYPISFGIGNHCMCLIGYRDYGWPYFAKDSNSAGIDNGYGRGYRGINADALHDNGFDFCVMQKVDISAALPVVVVTPPPSPTPIGNTQMLIDTIKADANALVLGQITQAQVDKIRADVAQLVADAAVPVKAATVTTLTSSLNPAQQGQSVVFTATVNGVSPTGSVQFKAGATNIGSAVNVNNSGVAQYTTSSLSVATHSITAVYAGDANNAGSTSAAISQSITGSPSNTGAIAPPNPIPRDGANISWTWGTKIRDDLGWQVLCNGKAVKTITYAAVVNGQFRCLDPGAGGWYAFTGNPAANVYTWASSSAP